MANQASQAAIQALMGLPATREPPPKRTQEIRKLPKRTPDEIVRDWWINLSPQERAMEALSWVFPPSMGVLKIAGIPKGLIQIAKLKAAEELARGEPLSQKFFKFMIQEIPDNIQFFIICTDINSKDSNI